MSLSYCTASGLGKSWTVVEYHYMVLICESVLAYAVLTYALYSYLLTHVSHHRYLLSAVTTEQRRSLPLRSPPFLLLVSRSIRHRLGVEHTF